MDVFGHLPMLLSVADIISRVGVNGCLGRFGPKDTPFGCFREDWERARWRLRLPR